MASWETEIEEDLTWREQELVALKKEALLCPTGSPKQRVLLRAMVALLYAHYEGFCKFAWDLYLSSVERTGVVRADCKPEFARLSMARAFKAIKGDLTADALWTFCHTTFPGLLAASAEFPIRLETRSNLWPSLLRENCALILLPHEMADLYDTELKALVSRRNDIAHGQKMIVAKVEDYQALEHAALLVMHELGVGVVEALDKALYRL
jgi:hypothetical protein